MAILIKPLVTEKMTKITDKSSEPKKLVARSKKTAEKFNATEEVRSYIVKNRRHKEGLKKEKKILVYEKPALFQYGFIVKPEATKEQIKNEVENFYNVKVLAVNTLRYTGKRSSRYTRSGLIKGQKNAFKKAIVTLKEGDTIDFYGNI